MTTESNIDLVRRYFEALSRGDMAELGAVMADDVVWHQPGQGGLSGIYAGKDQLFSLFGQFMERSGGSFRIDEVREIMANSDFVAASLHFSAQRAGQAIAMNGVDLMRVADGKIQEVWLFSGDQAAEDAFWG